MQSGARKLRNGAEDALLKVLDNVASFRGEARFTTWIYSIARNLCIDHLRREKERVVSLDQPMGADDDLSMQLASGGAGPDREAESKEMMAILEEALALLPEHYRIIVVLRHQEQLSYEEISDTLGIPLGTVKSRIRRALQRLRVRMGGA